MRKKKTRRGIQRNTKEKANSNRPFGPYEAVCGNYTLQTTNQCYQELLRNVYAGEKNES